MKYRCDCSTADVNKLVEFFIQFTRVNLKKINKDHYYVNDLFII